MSNVDVTRDAPRAPLAPVDAAVKIPDAVRRAAEIADNYYKKPDPPVDGQAAPPVDPNAPTHPSPVTPPVGAAAGTEPPVAPVAPPADGQVTAPVTPPTPPAAPEGGDNWEHKFKSQQGRIAALNQQNRQMQDQLVQMSDQLIAAMKKIEAATAAPPPRQKLVTAEDEQTYGSDFIDVARRAAKEELNPEVSALTTQVQELKQTIQKSSRDQLYQTLDSYVPDWKEINRHPVFFRWLALRDPISGAIRKQLLDGAFQAADAARVVAIFQGFLAEDAASRPAAPAAPPPPAAGVQPPARVPAVELAALAAPGRARSAPASGAAVEKPIYSHAQIAQFYRDSAAGAFAGREAEKAAIEADIFAAQREGRVRG